MVIKWGWKVVIDSWKPLEIRWLAVWREHNTAAWSLLSRLRCHQLGMASLLFWDIRGTFSCFLYVGWTWRRGIHSELCQWYRQPPHEAFKETMWIGKKVTFYLMCTDRHWYSQHFQSILYNTIGVSRGAGLGWGMMPPHHHHVIEGTFVREERSI